ncbi:MAG: preprotein translocase subunit SecY [Christensenellaceae bacterium]|nr:preprotein translocase subunit SecY [Christensenellaceae bacterium]
MLETIRKLWKIEDLRKKILYTFFMLILFRLVGVIPAPGVDAARVLNSAGTDLPLLQLVNMMTGNAFSQMTIMAMGITPYINSSIIMQLLTFAIPALERMQQDEAGGGREKIARITRYVTVALAAIQAIGLVAGLGYIKSGWLNYVLVGISMAGGTALAMWIGERITDKGIGNGISLLIFVGIISNLFNGIVSGFGTAFATGTSSAWMSAVAIIVVALVMTVIVTFVDLGERRIPLQIAKQVKGRRVYGGQSTHMTLKVVSVGVLPLIFAYSFLAFPGTIIQLVGGTNSGAYVWWTRYMNTGSVWYMIISALLIVAFTFFYSSISFDPRKQAEQLIQQGAVIPGQRGKNIQSYLQRTMNRLNLFAALFLAVLAAVPTLLTAQLNASVPFAASSILIAVSVSLETIRTIEGEMSIRGIETDKETGFM